MVLDLSRTDVAMAEKVTTMVLKVDLKCTKCYKKVKKVLCKFPQVQDQVFDEKNNTVKIKVVCCSPEKIRDKLCSKGGGSIKSIEILKPPEKPKEPEKKPPVRPKVLTTDLPPPTREPPDKVLTADLPPPTRTLLETAAPGYPATCHVPVGFSCSDYYGGGGGGPCYGQPGRHYDGYYGRPVYDSWGGGHRGYCGGGSNQCFCEENSQGCRIM